LWFNHGGRSLPLVTAGDTPVLSLPGAFFLGSGFTHIPTSPGFIGLNHTVEALGPTSTGGSAPTLAGRDPNNSMHTGVRAFVGGWIDDSRTLGFEAGYLLSAGGRNYNVTSPGNPLLRIPYVDAATGVPTAYVISQIPGASTLTTVFINTTPDVFVGLSHTVTTDAAVGSVQMRTTDLLQGGEFNGIWSPVCSPCFGLKLLAGVRFLELDQTFSLVSNVLHETDQTTGFEAALGLPTGAVPVINNTSAMVHREDHFSTHNSFFGGQLGFQGEYRWNQLSFLLGMKCAVGDAHEQVNINGGTTIVTTTLATTTRQILLAGIPINVANPSRPATMTNNLFFPLGGLFAQPTNGGPHARDVMVIVPEVNGKLVYRITDRLSASFGYSFLLMTDVAQPTNHIDTVVNSALLSGANVGNVLNQRPVFTFHNSTYWVQGVDFGIQFRF
jgi:hypothetical protein